MRTDNAHKDRTKTRTNNAHQDERKSVVGHLKLVEDEVSAWQDACQAAPIRSIPECSRWLQSQCSRQSEAGRIGKKQKGRISECTCTRVGASFKKADVPQKDSHCLYCSQVSVSHPAGVVPCARAWTALTVWKYL